MKNKIFKVSELLDNKKPKNLVSNLDRVDFIAESQKMIFQYSSPNFFKPNNNNSVTDSVTDSVTSSVTKLNSVTDSVTDSVTSSVTKLNSVTDSVTTETSLRNNSVTDSVTSSVTTETSLRNNSVTDKSAKKPPQNEIFSLSGHKLKIMELLFSLCQNRNALDTGKVSRDYLVSQSGIGGEVIRITILRLTLDEYLKIIDSKRGNGGYSIYQINPYIYGQMIKRQFSNNSVTTETSLRNNSVTDSVTDSVTTPSSKIDSINTNYLTKKNTVLKIEADQKSWFLNLDFSKIPGLGPMQINPVIRKLVHEKLDQEIVQSFMDRFISWSTTQKNIKSNIGLFCDKLKELANEGDSPVFQFPTEEERFIEIEMAKASEKARLEMEFINKEQDNILKTKVNEQFENWFLTLSDEQKITMAPTNSIATLNSSFHKVLLKEFFKKNVWSKSDMNL